MKQKIVILIFIIIFSISFSCVDYNASENNVIMKTAQFTIENNNPKYDKFSAEIEESGKKYELSDIAYNLLDTNKKTVQEEKTITIVKDDLSSKIYSVDSNASYYHQNLNVDGKEYLGTLINVEYENHTKTNRYGEVSGSKNYGLRSSKPSPPSIMSLQYYDSETGQTLTVDAPMTSLETTSSEWQDYTYIDITVSNYTDTQFMFNNKIVKHNGDTVLPDKYYGELLDMAGLSSSNHKIKSVYWIGDSYKQVNIKYRKARADIQAYSCAYKAHYYKRFSLNDIPTYTATLTYKYAKENIIQTEYKYVAVATYELIEVETTQHPTTEPISTRDEIPVAVKTITTISVLLATSLIFVLLFMFLLAKIKTKNFRYKKRR